MPEYGPCLWCDGTGLTEAGEICWGCNGTAVEAIPEDEEDR